jgi:polyisoprenoid-binding protein YceI
MSTAVSSSTSIPQGVWNIDPSHSSVEFAVRHMKIATVRGQFREYSGAIDATGEAPVLAGTVKVASITTHDEQRDAHLGAPDFFDVERYPEIAFNSTAIELPQNGELTLAGDITIKGVTKPIVLKGTVAGPDTDPWGNERIGLDVSTTIDRREFDLNWNQDLPGGGLLVDNEVTLILSGSAVKGE